MVTESVILKEAVIQEYNDVTNGSESINGRCGEVTKAGVKETVALKGMFKQQSGWEKRQNTNRSDDRAEEKRNR
jgi:hypothetical protein